MASPSSPDSGTRFRPARDGGLRRRAPAFLRGGRGCRGHREDGDRRADPRTRPGPGHRPACGHGRASDHRGDRQALGVAQSGGDACLRPRRAHRDPARCGEVPCGDAEFRGHGGADLPALGGDVGRSAGHVRGRHDGPVRDRAGLRAAQRPGHTARADRDSPGGMRRFRTNAAIPCRRRCRSAWR